MKRHLWLLVLLAQSGLAFDPVLAAEPADERCANLLAHNFRSIPDAPTTITSAQTVAASDALPAYCRVEGYVAPQVWFEARLPLTKWNEKFLMQGCGGMCGAVNMEACEDALNRHYAVANTDMGHKAPPFSALWAYNNRQAEIDFGYRATHVVAIAVKAIIAGYYGSGPSYSYFRGCSTGGRQGLVSAQRFPDDFDGIISGAPVIHQPGTAQLHLLWLGLANRGDDGQPILTTDKVPLLHDAVIAACDATDGLEDGILMDPRACTWDPEALACDDTQHVECLSDEQVQAARRIYGPARDSKGRPLFPGGLMKGSEPEWVPAIVAPPGETSVIMDEHGLIADVLRYLTFDQDPGPDYTLFDFNFDADHQRFGAMSKLNAADNPDLSRFARRGGKLILYHGWGDLEIPPLGSVEYYEDVTEFMGTPAATQKFFRLFMLPGVAHCRRGPGADAIDYLSYLENWVENDQPPDALMSHHLIVEQNYLGLPRPRFPLPAAGYDWTRPVFPYPQVARFNGRGDWRDVTNWVPAQPR